MTGVTIDGEMTGYVVLTTTFEELTTWVGKTGFTSSTTVVIVSVGINLGTFFSSTTVVVVVVTVSTIFGGSTMTGYFSIETTSVTVGIFWTD